MDRTLQESQGGEIQDTQKQQPPPSEESWDERVIHKDIAITEQNGFPDAEVTVDEDIVATGSQVGKDPVTDAKIEDPAEKRKRSVSAAALSEVLANVYFDPIRQTVALLLDERHASAVIYAVRALAADYEAHAREVRTVAATFPPDSYGALNRHFIAIRHERIASRLRTVESNYRAEVSGYGRPPD